MLDGLDAAGQARWLSQTSSWRAATTELAQMELQTGAKSHPLLRHGDQVELAQLQKRALEGVTPDGAIDKQLVNATRWLNNEDMLAAVKQAQSAFQSSGGGKPLIFEVDLGRVIGEGYYAGTSTYAKATSIKVLLDAKGMPITAYPVLP